MKVEKMMEQSVSMFIWEIVITVNIKQMQKWRAVTFLNLWKEALHIVVTDHFCANHSEIFAATFFSTNC